MLTMHYFPSCYFPISFRANFWLILDLYFTKRWLSLVAPWAFSSDFLLSPFGTVLLHLFPYLWNIDLSNWSRQISCTLLFYDIRQQHKKYLRARGRQKFPGEISFPPISLLYFVKMCESLCFLEKYLFFCFPFSQLSQCVTLADKHDADGA